ncbi:MAG TPA: hypothetical protein VMK12_04710 [Anaeromyxobacteraceae bacterium]|nr:hypothetical protein [Anaeromyxobacteraceae bacterium]
MTRKIVAVLAALGAGILFASFHRASADDFTKADLERWEKEYMTVVAKGQELWGSATLGTNGVACGQCHPNAANTHPETYPKFQKQLGRVIAFREMINWCLRNPLQGKPLALDDPKMIALEAYAIYERRGVPLAPGKH